MPGIPVSFSTTSGFITSGGLADAGGNVQAFLTGTTAGSSPTVTATTAGTPSISGTTVVRFPAAGFFATNTPCEPGSSSNCSGGTARGWMNPASDSRRSQSARLNSPSGLSGLDPLPFIVPEHAALSVDPAGGGAAGRKVAPTEAVQTGAAPRRGG